MFQRRLGRSGLQVGALGLGCWAIGGPMWRGESPVGWGDVDDAESIRAMRRALDLGITFFDTADVYGCGHSERVIGRALGSRRSEAIIATKFGATFDEATRQMTGTDTSPDYIRRACEASLRRLDTDYLDVYQFHLGEVRDPDGVIRDVLEDLAREGKIRWYGRSSPFLEDVRVELAQGPHCATSQCSLNLARQNDFDRQDDDYDAVCAKHDLAWIANSPLEKGLLTGKFTAASRMPADDVRRRWDFGAGQQATFLRQLDALRATLTSDGRNLGRGALGWVWARSPRTIPIPGFKTTAQVEDLAAAASFGPLSPGQMTSVAETLARSAEATR